MQDYGRRFEPPRLPKGFRFIVAGIIVIVLGAVVASMMFVQVQVGNALLLVDPWFKKDVSQVVATGPSLQLKMPWEQPIQIYYATDTYSATIPCFSKDQLEMKIQILMRWSLDTKKIRDLYMSYPRLDYEDMAIKSVSEETIRLITKKYSTLETIEFRDKVAGEIEDAILSALRRESSLADALVRLEFDLKNIEYPASYTKAIEDKNVKEQEKIAAEFERERTLVLANATAQRLILEAEGQAQARKIVADSIKDAIQLIITSANSTNTTDTVAIAQNYLYLDTLRQIAPDVGVLILGENKPSILYQIPPANSTGP